MPHDISVFCSQECFKDAWAQHKQEHKPSSASWLFVTDSGQSRQLHRPDFEWTGTLRPFRWVCMAHSGNGLLTRNVQHERQFRIVACTIPHTAQLMMGSDPADALPGCMTQSDLRRVGPQRIVPEGIPCPEWRHTGTPYAEMSSRQQRIVPERTAKEIEGLRAACQLGRRILDAAHAAIKPGVTTDDIDKVRAWKLVAALCDVVVQLPLGMLQQGS